MPVELEIAGDVLAEAVVVNELANGGQAGAAVHGSHQCANCGATLNGAFCHQCGQSAHIHHSLLHLVEELLHGLLHFETKAWRTIPLLLFRPGKLTREYIDGRRTRYVSPLALLLFLIFLMFFVFSLTGADVPATDDAQARVTIQRNIDAGRAKLNGMQADLAKLPADQIEARAAVTEDMAEQRGEIVQFERKLQGLEAKAARLRAGQPEPTDSSSRLTQEKVHISLDKGLPWLATPSFEKKIVHAFENKELTLYKIKGSAAKFAFLLMPISLPFLWLLFMFKRQYRMFDHAVFSLYSLSAMALLMMAAAIFGYFDFDGTAAMLGMFLPPLHMFAQLRGSYALSRWAAAWRTLALVLIASCSLVIYSLLVVLLSM